MLGFFYGQTEYSMLENSIPLSTYVLYAKREGFSFLTITDQNLHGHYKFYQACVSEGIKPIIGLKTRIQGMEYHRLEAAFSSQSPEENYILLYAKNQIGYRNLLAIATEQSITKIVSDSFLLKHHEGIICVTAGHESLIHQLHIIDMNDRKQERIRLGQLFQEVYIGFDPRMMTQEQFAFFQSQQEQFLPLYQTLYVAQGDRDVYEALCEIAGKKSKDQLEHNLKSKEELEKLFFNAPTFEGLPALIDTFSVQIEEVNGLLKYPFTKNLSSDEYLRELAYYGIRKRLLKHDRRQEERYLKRINYELDIITRMGYADYFLIVLDIVKYAKRNEILVGPGRGSASASLVSYAIGITEIDSLEFDLLFERFLNPARISMPDIDIDFPDDKRMEIIHYAQKRFGKEHVCMISTFGTFQIKSSLRDISKIYQIKQTHLEAMLLAAETKTEEELFVQFAEREDLSTVLRIAKKIEGLPRHLSTHAAGIILSEQPLLNLIPLIQGSDGLYQSQLDADDLARLGLLKFDLLGIRNLSIIHRTVLEINKTKRFSLQEIPLDDSKIFRMLQTGDTLGIFQLESAGITKVIKNLKPTCFEDLVAVIALYRPGPMENISEYILRKNGKPFEYLHPCLKEVLAPTYGVIVYQEQIMKILNIFAGYSYAEADILRKAISKKNLQDLQEGRRSFLEKAQAMHHSAELANQIYEYILKFANYGFNRAHSVSYGVLAYQMAYLKVHYFAEFMSNILNNVVGNASQLKSYIRYCSQHGLKIYSPEINHSSNTFVAYRDGLILPFQAVHSINEITAQKVLEERKNGAFQSFQDFINRMKSSINEKAIKMLIHSGAFDLFGHSKKSLIEKSGENQVIYDTYITDKLMITEEYPLEELRANELEALGFWILYDLFKEYDLKIKKMNCISPIQLRPAKNVQVLATLERMKKIKTKMQQPMAFLTLNANSVEIDTVLFTEHYDIIMPNLIENELLIFFGDMVQRDGKLQLVLKGIRNI